MKWSNNFILPTGVRFARIMQDRCKFISVVQRDGNWIGGATVTLTMVVWLLICYTVYLFFFITWLFFVVVFFTNTCIYRVILGCWQTDKLTVDMFDRLCVRPTEWLESPTDRPTTDWVIEWRKELMNGGPIFWSTGHQTNFIKAQMNKRTNVFICLFVHSCII